MALLDDKAREELPDDVVAEVDGAEEDADKKEAADEEPPLRVRLSRRKKDQEDRDAREKQLEERISAAERAREEESRRYQSEIARIGGAIEQLARQREAPAVAAKEEDTEASLSAKIERQRKKAQEALGKGDLDEYHNRMERIMDLKADAKVRAIPAPPQQQQQFTPQKPDWVRAVEFQYPDVMTHANGQRTAAAVEALIAGDFGPEKLHRMFQKARIELGLHAPSNGAPAGQRQLYAGIQSTAVGNRRSANGDRTVNVPQDYLRVALRSGMTKTEAAKAWADSYPSEVEK